MDATKRIFAFISYNHKDVKWAKWLRNKLEWYRLPSEINNEFETSKYIRPVFRDRDEMSGGILNDILYDKLRLSKYLIVICSTNSANSTWVSDEVQAFIDMKREEFIIPFIVNGEPGDYRRSEDCVKPLPKECFPLALRKWNLENPTRNILGIPILDENTFSKEKALVRVVSYMLQVNFDILWKRRERDILKLAFFSGLLSLLVLSLIYWFGAPVNVKLNISEPETSLPGMRSGIAKLCDKEVNVYDLNAPAIFNNMPGYFRFHKVPIVFEADRFFEKYESTERIGFGINNSFIISLKRNSTFAIYAGKVLDESGNGIGGAIVKVGTKKTLTDPSGFFHLSFTLKEQKTTNAISISKDGYRAFSREDECPSSKLVYLLQAD